MIATVDDFCQLMLRWLRLFSESFPAREECLMTFPKHYLTAIPEFADMAKFQPAVSASLTAQWAICPLAVGIQFGLAADGGITAAMRLKPGPITTWTFLASEITNLYLAKLAGLHAAALGAGGRVEIVLPPVLLYPAQPKSAYNYHYGRETFAFDPRTAVMAVRSCFAPHSAEIAYRESDVVMRGTAPAAAT